MKNILYRVTLKLNSNLIRFAYVIAGTEDEADFKAKAIYKNMSPLNKIDVIKVEMVANINYSL